MQFRSETFAVIFALFLTVLTVWLGIAGPVFVRAQSSGWYEIWKDNNQFIATAIAALIAWWVARPILHQVRIQNAQAALTLLKVVEEEVRAVDEELKLISEAWWQAGEFHTALALSSLHGPPTLPFLSDLVGKFVDRDVPNRIRNLTARATMDVPTAGALEGFWRQIYAAQSQTHRFITDLETDGKLTSVPISEALTSLKDAVHAISVEGRKRHDEAMRRLAMLRNKARELRIIAETF